MKLMALAAVLVATGSTAVAADIAQQTPPATRTPQTASPATTTPDANTPPSDPRTGTTGSGTTGLASDPTPAGTEQPAAAPSDATRAYPRCSRTVKDQCRQSGGRPDKSGTR